MNKKHLAVLIPAICIMICLVAFLVIPRGDYQIFTSDSSYGSIEVRGRANAGDRVKIKVDPNREYNICSLFVNGEELSDSEFIMPGSDVRIDVSYANRAAGAYSVTVEDSADGAIVSDLLSATQGQTVTLTAYPVYNRILDYFTVNGERIEGNSFTMPASGVRVGAVYKSVYGETNISLSLAASYQKATSYWYARYTDNGIEVRTVVEDNLIFTSKKGTRDLAMADNIEFVIGLKSNSSTITNRTYKMLVNADGEYFYQQGSDSGYVTVSNYGIDVQVKRLNIFTHGMSGYETVVTIPYSKLGTTYVDAYENICICPAMRNTTNTLKTVWGYYSEMNCNWSVPSTHLLIYADGSIGMGITNSNYLFTGDDTLSSAAGVSGMSALKGISTYTVKSSTINYWINNIDEILKYQAGEVYFCCGTEDLESKSALATFNDMREFIDLFKSSSKAKLHIVSAIPTIYSKDTKAVEAFNLMVKEYAERMDGVEFIDFCKDVCSDGVINKSLYGSETALSDMGQLLLAKHILSARNLYSEEYVSSNWGSVDSYIYSGDWSYAGGALKFREGGAGYIYYKGDMVSDFVLECSISVSEIYNGDQYPKFGMMITNENHSRYYYISAVDMTEQIAGVVEKPYTGYDWVNGTTYAVDGLAYKAPDSAKLKIVKYGGEILYYINGELMASTTEDSFGGEDVAFGLFSFNLALDVTDIRIVTDPDMVKAEVED